VTHQSHETSDTSVTWIKWHISHMTQVTHQSHETSDTSVTWHKWHISHMTHQSHETSDTSVWSHESRDIFCHITIIISNEVPSRKIPEDIFAACNSTTLTTLELHGKQWDYWSRCLGAFSNELLSNKWFIEAQSTHHAGCK